MIKKQIENSALYLLISKPGLYLKKIAYRTLCVGVVSFVLSLIYINTDLHKLQIPSTMHGLLGVVIGLLLVFRINTAYDRWWDGRKVIASLSSEVSYFYVKLKSSKVMWNNRVICKMSIERLGLYLISLRDYLKNSDVNVEDVEFHKKQTKLASLLMITVRLADKNIEHPALDGSMQRILEHTNKLECIKNTPIPVSYRLHINISIMIYLMTLPFGLFHDLGLYSSLMVMTIYYIIAGVEIISDEIENPFAGDMNDLPVDGLFNTMLSTINYKPTEDGRTILEKKEN